MRLMYAYHDMTPQPDFVQITKDLRRPMLRFASLHLQPREEAEDVVQDAFTALLTSSPQAWESSGIKPYVFGILKHKVIDRLRHQYRSGAHWSAVSVDELDETLFDERGHWVDGVAPSAWQTPVEKLQTHQFFRVVDMCVNQLPAKPARVFSMKEFLECDADEICTTLGLTKTDYWQCISRARKQIQLCLNEKWFQGKRPS